MSEGLRIRRIADKYRKEAERCKRRAQNLLAQSSRYEARALQLDKLAQGHIRAEGSIHDVGTGGTAE